jgi:hypothetical protein
LNQSTYSSLAISTSSTLRHGPHSASTRQLSPQP